MNKGTVNGSHAMLDLRSACLNSRWLMFDRAAREAALAELSRLEGVRA